MVAFKEVLLGDIFDFQKSKTNNSSFTKYFINENQGSIPVYGASKYYNAPTYGYIKDNVQGVLYFEDCITWNIDGSINCFYRKGRFSLSEKVIPLYLKENIKKQFNKSYLIQAIKLKASEEGFSREYKPNQTKLKTLSIPIPIKPDGSFDLEKQKEIARRYQRIHDFQAKIQEYLDTLKKCTINIEQDNNAVFEEMPINDVFNISKGNSKYTRQYFLTHSGKYPVYSSQTKNNGVIGRINTFDFDFGNEACITWATDGIHAGTTFLRKNKFSMTTHCGLLKFKTNSIDALYCKHILQILLKDSTVGEQNKRVTSSIIKTLSIPIPIKPDGSFDLEKQKEIANRYQAIEDKKTKIIDALEQITKVNVRIDLD